MTRKAKMIGLHVLAWLFVFALIAAFSKGFGNGGFNLRILQQALFVLLYASLFYLNASVLLPKLYLRKKYFFYFGAAFLLLILVSFFKPFQRTIPHGDGKEHAGPPPFRERPPGAAFRPPHQDFGRREPDFDLVSIVLFLAVWSASSVFEILGQWRTSERRAAQAEADKVTAELSFLKAQINPHFLFNTLNNIYSLAITHSEHTADAVLKLSAILRYLTDDVRQDFVPLQSEIDCATNYIELQKLRLNKKATVEFLVEGEAAGKKIAPLVLMTFIENAFKYGISNHEPSDINIRIRVNESNIHFFCRNQVFKRDEEDGEREGVGINNARKRLDYLYPEKYLLNLHTQNGSFTVDLTVAA